MQYCIILFNSLIPDVTRNTRLVPKLADRIHKVTIRPKLTSPKLFLHFRVLLEYLLCRDAFQHCYYTGGAHFWNRLNQKMNMILIRTYFQKMNIITLFNLQTYVFQRFIYCLTKYYSPVLCWTNKMVQQHRYIVRFVYIFAFGHAYKDIVFAPQSGGELTP